MSTWTKYRINVRPSGDATRDALESAIAQRYLDNICEAEVARGGPVNATTIAADVAAGRLALMQDVVQIIAGLVIDAKAA